MRGKSDYLFQRPGSRNWHVKLQSPTGRIERSLRTSDRVQAEILALPMIADHKGTLLAARLRVEVTWQHKLEPGREHVGADGGRILATDRDLFHIGPDGAITRTEPNGGPVQQLIGGPLTVRSLVQAYTEKRPTLATKTSDDAIFETYLRHANISGYFEREARAVWSLYKTLTDSKPLKDAERDDGRKLVAHFEARGLKSASIQKKIMWLNAAVNFAINEGKLKFNPFSSIVPRRDDKTKRVPLSESDMKTCADNLGTLSETDQLLFRLLACTGMRLSEAFEIDGEQPKENGCRFVIVGKKTEQSLRRVPLPAGVLPYLPKVIKGSLFQGGAPNASKRLNQFLNDIGIVDKRKVIHSLRHRAQDRLRAAGAPEDIRWSILGHEKATVAASYGRGFAVPLLRKWIDKIGFHGDAR